MPGPPLAGRDAEWFRHKADHVMRKRNDMTQHHEAVTFDVAAFQAWLDYRRQPGNNQSPTNRDANNLLAAAYQRLDGDAGWLVETTLADLHAANDAHLPTELLAWRYADGVSDVKVWATAAAEGGSDGGLVGEVVVDGVAVSIGRLTEADLVEATPSILPGYEAAEQALTAVAEAVNAVAGKYRATGLPGDSLYGSLSNADIETALATLADYRENGGHPALSPRQIEVTERVTQLMLYGEAVDGEVVEDSAYQAAAAAVDHDVNNRANPTHW